MAEAQIDGKIVSVPRTRHGEDRLPNIEKYELGEGYRLVVQLIDSEAKHRIFLYVGSHDSCQTWLDTHFGHKYVRKLTDSSFALVPLTEESEPHHIIMPPAAILTDAEIATPLFGRIPDAVWASMKLAEDVSGQLQKMTISDTLEGSLSVIEGVMISAAHRNFLFDIAAAALDGDWSAVEKRIEVFEGNAEVIPRKSVSEAFQETPTNEEYVTFGDTESLEEFQVLFARERYREWMLYLHPEQRALVTRTYNGPARIRGVSGSGKTSIVVHRAKFLVKTYGWPVAVVTYTATLKELLVQMFDDLCGAERGLVKVFTMNEFARNVLDLYPPDAPPASQLYAERLEEAERSAMQEALHIINDQKSLASLRLEGDRDEFFKSEIDYIRTRFTRTQRERYFTAARRGRKFPLTEDQRKAVLLSVLAYEDYFRKHNIRDFQACVLDALYSIEQTKIDWEIHRRDMPRAIVADEIQDFSENEIRLLAALLPQEMEDTLFLVGDGAQKVYKKSFSLSDAGVDVRGRAVILKKNYRNTRQILEASYALIKDYSFDDLDSEVIAKPMLPDYSSREGEKPLLIKHATEQEEFRWIAEDIKQHIKSKLVSPGEIIILAPSVRIRQAIQQNLQDIGLAASSLRDDIAVDSGNVKISTIESAKGLEFPFVYIAGLVEGVLPPFWEDDEDGERLHASRLYVAMTRARDRLVMTWSVLGQSDRRCNPSIYLSKIQIKCNEMKNQGGSLKMLDD